MKSKNSETQRRKALEANSLLAAIVESSDDAIIGKTLDGIILSWNRGAQNIYGYTADEVLGKSVSILVHPDHTDEVPQLLQRIRKGQRIEHYETVRMRKDGKQIDISLTISPIRDSTGKIIGASTIARDITERKRAEEELRQSEGRLRLLSDLTMEGIVIHDKGIILDANEALARMFGYGNVSEVIGKSGADLMTPESQELLQQHIVTGSDEPYEAVGIKKDGTRFSIEIHGSNIKYKGKTVRTGVVRDLTERKRAEEALRQSEERFRLALQNMPITVANLDRDLRYTWVYNPKGGFTLEEVLGKRIGLSVDSETSERIAKILQDVLTTGTPVRWETPSKTKTGEIFSESYAEALRNSNGEITGVALVSVDITERKRMEEALRESEMRYRTLFESMGEGFAIAEMVFDPEGKPVDYIILEINRAYERQAGLRSEQVLGRRVTEFLDQVEPVWFERYGGVVSKGEPQRFEEYNASLDSWFSVYAFPLPIRNRYGIIFSDITQRKRAEEELRESRNLFKVLTQNLHSGVALIDEQGKFSIVNPAFLRMFDLSEESDIKNVNDRNWAEWQVFDENGRLLDVDEHPVRKAALTGKPVQNKLVGVLSPSSKDFKWMLISAAPILKPDGRMEALICTYHDITERKLAEISLKTDLAALTRMHALSGKLLEPGGLQPLLQEIMDAAVAIMGAERGTLQLLEGDSLRIVAHHRHQQPFLEFFEFAEDRASACGAAMKSTERVIIPDVEKSSLFVEMPSLAVLREAGVRAVQSTPMISRTGALLGIITTQWGVPYSPNEHDLWRIDLLARQAADLTEHSQAKDALRKSHDELELRIQERTADLANVNEKLQVEIAERRRAEEAAKTERQRLYDVLETMPVMVCLLTPDYQVAFTNRSFREKFGEPRGRHCYEYCFGRREPCEFCESYKVLETGQPHHWEVTGPDGSVIDAYDFPLTDVDGSPMILEMDIDITERKRAEEAVKVERQRFNDILDMLPAYLVLLSPDYHVPFANRFFRERFGESRGFRCFEYLFKRCEPCEICETYSVLKTMAPHHWEWTGPDGHNYDIFDFPFTDTDGSTLIMEVGIDITERKQAEEKIREQAKLLDNAQEAIGVRSLEHSLTYWNKGAQRLYGWTKEEALGKNPVEFLFKDKEEPPQLIEAKRIVLEKGEWTGELHQVTKDGREVTVESHWTLIYDSEGKPKSILVVNTDITEKKLFEAHLLRAQRMESIGILAGGIAHNLNNMLTPMMMSLHTLKQKFKDEQSQKLLTILEKNSERSADLIKQVLSFSRGVEGERNPLHVANIVLEIEKIAKETFPRNIEIRTNMPIDIWTISGDTTQLHQVIMNLCVNAGDAMPDGGILNISAENISIDENYARIHTEAKVGSYVAISVSDTGVGIPPKILDRIFEPFFTTKEFGKGTGLGLSTVLAIVKSHGGFINVESKVGKGTIFSVYLPAILAEIQNTEEQQLELPTGHGELVLVVEDEDSVREVTISSLEANGYKVLAAEDGAQAVAEYAQNADKIKVVLMDMMMPVMDGEASIRAVRRINPKVKVIVVSGLAEKDKLAKIKSTHAQAILQKPYTAERLLKAIHEVLSAK